MPRGASFHMQAITNPVASEIHNTRTWTLEHPAPKYLLPDGKQQVIGDLGEGYKRVIATADPRVVRAEKMILATGKARSMPDYSPTHEGVLNLPHPNAEMRAGGYERMVRAFVEGYEQITAKTSKGKPREGHKVLTVDIHLDEGRVDESGRVRWNAHAHIVVDRTDAAGRPIRMTAQQLRQVQDLAAQVTGMQRGKDARETRRKHLNHGAYRGLAQAGLLQSQEDLEMAQQQAAEDLQEVRRRARQEGIQEGQKANAAARERSEDYGVVRGLLKASGRATQQDYMEAKDRLDRGDRKWLQARAAELEAEIEAMRAGQAKDQALAAAARNKAANLAEEANPDAKALEILGGIFYAAEDMNTAFRLMDIRQRQAPAAPPRTTPVKGGGGTSR